MIGLGRLILSSRKLGRGGSSSGSTSDYGLRGPGLIPAGSRAFFSSQSYQMFVLNQVPDGGATLLIFLHKLLSCAA